MSKVLGIDLGTTNSCAAVVDVAAPRVLSNREGSRTTASIVAFTEDGDRLVGQIAKRQAITNPQNTVFAVKRLIGRKFSDPEIQRAREVLPFPLVEAANGDVTIQVRDREYSPEEMSAFILREIKGFAEEVLGEEVQEAIVTVPAYFNDSSARPPVTRGRSPVWRFCASSTSPPLPPWPMASIAKAKPRRSPSTISVGAPSTSRFWSWRRVFSRSKPPLAIPISVVRILISGSWTG